MFKNATDNHRTNVLNLLTNVKVYQLNTFPHHVHANDNVIQNSNYKYAYQSADIISTYPKPLFTDVNLAVEENIVSKLVQQKNQYLFDVKKASTCFLKANDNPQSKLANKRGIYSLHLNNVIELIENDPDPYFFGSYNWYYTGGNLEILSLENDIDVLLHTSGTNGSNLNFSLLNAIENEIQLEPLHSSNEYDTIYGIYKAINNQYVAIRQKNTFKILYIDRDYSKESLRTKQFCSDIPFVSGTFHESKYFLTIDMFRRIQKYDLESEKSAAIRKMKRATDNNYWCQIKSYRKQILFANSDSVEMLDNRTLGQNSSNGLRINLSQLTEICEDITGVQVCYDDNHFQVATTHNLFTFDIRKCAGAAAQLTRTTHLLKTPPLLMDNTCMRNDRTITDTLFALGGSLADDIVVSAQSKNHIDNTIQRMSMQKILTVNNAYDKLRENGSLHDTAQELMTSKDIAKCQNTGLKFYKNNSNTFLFTQNCFGQVFYQTINTCSMDAGEKADFTEDQMEAWHQAFDKKAAKEKSKSFAATTVTNFNSLQNLLKYEMPMETECKVDVSAYIPKWRRSIEELSLYKDVLTADLLSIWSIKATTGIEEKADRKDIVESWLNSAVA